MAREIRNTKMILDKRRDKLREFDIIETKIKERNELIKRENDELIKSHTNLLGNISLLESSLKEKEIEANVLLNDIGIYSSDISDLKLIQENTIEDIKEMYSGLDKKLSEVQQKLDNIKSIYRETHQKCVKEQDIIQSQKRDLEIYRIRLQKKYDELKFGKVVLVEK
jgi:chromosome segregation ATPase